MTTNNTEIIRNLEHENQALRAHCERLRSEIVRTERKEAWHDAHPLSAVAHETPHQSLSEIRAEAVESAIACCERGAMETGYSGIDVDDLREYAQQLKNGGELNGIER